MATITPCPCGTEIQFHSCCEPFIQGTKKPDTAEKLLRSRYTAFVKGEIDYILGTHHPKTSGELKREDIESWSKDSRWLGLKILGTEGGTPKDEKATLIFQARYQSKDGQVHDHYEKSTFEKLNGDWKFYDGEGLKPNTIKHEGPRIGRNDPCPCGSGNKYKKCCLGKEPAKSEAQT